MQDLEKLVAIFDLSESEKRIYEKLFSSGESSAGDLAKRVRVSRPAIYDLTKKLIEKGLVLQTVRGGVKIFSVQNLDYVQGLIQSKKDELKKSESALEVLRETEQSLQQGFGPRLQVFEGREALQRMMHEVLLHDNVEISTYWPIKQMLDLFTPEFFHEYDMKRRKVGITVKAIWPQDHGITLKEYPFLESRKDFQRSIRIAPKGADFTLGYSIYGNSVRFVSSQQENFGFIVESHELVKTMKSQFDIIWSLSKPIGKW